MRMLMTGANIITRGAWIGITSVLTSQGKNVALWNMGSKNRNNMKEVPGHVRDGGEHELVNAEHDCGDSRRANRWLSEDTLQAEMSCIKVDG